MRTTLNAAAIAGLFFGVAIAPVLVAQEQPLNIQGIFTTGYYNTYTRGIANQSLGFVPFGAQFEIDGFYKTPDFLSFSAQPELNVGPQASEAGFQGGNGGVFRVTFLRRLVPITFHYSNVQVQDVYFGSLTQISGYSLQTRNKDLGLTLELNNKRLPVTTIDWGITSVDSRSDVAQVSDYVSHGDHFNVDSQYQRFGWIFEGFVHRQEEQSDLLAPLDGGTTFGSLLQNVLQYQGSARRDFFGDWEWYADAGSQSTSSLLFTLPIDLTTHYANSNLRLFQKRRFKTLLRASYTSNIASQLLAQAAGSLTAVDTVLPDQTILLPFSHGISTLNLNGSTTAALSHGFTMYAAAEKNHTFSTESGALLAADYFTTSGGVTYTKSLPWITVSGEYGREFGLGSVTGQAGTIVGQTWRASVQKSAPDGFQIEGMVHGSDESVHSTQPLSNSSVSTEAAIGHRLIGHFSMRLGGGWQWSSIGNSANDFRTDGYTARASLDHPRVQFSAVLNNSVSDSLPLFNQLLGGLGIAGALFTPAVTIPSDYKSSSFTLHAYPLRKIELSALWTRSRQHIGGLLENDFEFMNIYATYHFRRIQFEAGLIHSNQTFAAYPYTVRQRFYVRIRRAAKLL